MMWSGGWGWGGWLMMASTMLVFWGLVAWAVVTLTRTGDRHSAGPRPADPDEILAERFARGEIDEEEFARRRTMLRSPR